MNAKEFIDAAGGPQIVMEITGLSRAGVSNWSTQNYIPTPWVKFFRLKVPAIRHATLDLAPTYYRKAQRERGQDVQILIQNKDPLHK